VFRDAAKKTGGSYVFGSGKKSVFTEGEFKDEAQL
jgi:hypothetical protein